VINNVDNVLLILRSHRVRSSDMIYIVL